MKTLCSSFKFFWRKVSVVPPSTFLEKHKVEHNFFALLRMEIATVSSCFLIVVPPHVKNKNKLCNFQAKKAQKNDPRGVLRIESDLRAKYSLGKDFFS